MSIPARRAHDCLASRLGQPRPPAWMHNLISHPAATIQVAGRTIDVTARLLHDPERQAVLDAAVAVYPPYAVYARRLRGRALPVFILEPPSERGGESSKGASARQRGSACRRYRQACLTTIRSMIWATSSHLSIVDSSRA